MKALRANESRTLGVLGCAGVVVALAVVAILVFRGNPPFALVLVVGGIVSAALMAWWGLRAQEIYLDGDELLVMRGKHGPLRLPISGVTSVRCGYALMNLRVMTFQHDSRETCRTLVREHDITWIMSRMPDRALTIYWREMISSGRTHF